MIVFLAAVRDQRHKQTKFAVQLSTLIFIAAPTLFTRCGLTTDHCTDHPPGFQAVQILGRELLLLGNTEVLSVIHQNNYISGVELPASDNQ